MATSFLSRRADSGLGNIGASPADPSRNVDWILMTVQFAPADMEAQMRVKDVFDPNWLLNPAKVFPLAVSETRRAG